MFFKLFSIFAVLAVAFANPNPKPDVVTYAAAPGVLPVAYSAYNAPLAYTAGGVAYGAAPVPYAYSGYYVR